MSSESRYKALFEQASDAIMITNFQGEFLDVNVSMCRMFGYSKPELLRMRIFDLIEGENLTQSPIMFDKLKTGAHVFSKRRMIDRNGCIVQVEANVKQIGDNEVLAIARDVRNLHQSERMLKLSETRFETAFESSAIGMALLSPQGQFIKVNKELLQMVGFDKEELLHMSMTDLMTPEESAICPSVLEEMNQAGEGHHHFQKKCLHKNGNVLWLNIHVSIVSDHNGKAEFHVVQFENFTKQKELTLHREKITSDLSERNNDLEQFAYIVSHNLRSPIANIMGASKLLFDGDLDPEEAKALLYSLNTSSEKLDAVVKELNQILQVKKA